MNSNALSIVGFNVNSSNNPIQSMNSQQIAELVQSRHADVKRTIERLAINDVIQLPPLAKVKNNQSLSPNNISKVYVFSGEQGKLDSITVVAQLCPHFTAQIVKRWQELEKKDVRKLDTLENQDIQKLKQALIDNNPRWQMIYNMAQINMSQRQMAGALHLSDSTVFREYAKMKQLGLLPKTLNSQLCLEV